jgi:uncharacterized membrane protein YphA (DoxX/SURF4 family)
MQLPTFPTQFLTLIFIQLLVGYEWLHAGLEKIIHGSFPGTMAKTLVSFSSQNPHAWYAKTVLAHAATRPELFGQLVQWGEFMTGLALIATALLWATNRIHSSTLWIIACIAPLIIGIVLNLNFYLAAGWMSPSTSTLNAFMGWIELILIVSWVLIQRSTVPSPLKNA